MRSRLLPATAAAQSMLPAPLPGQTTPAPAQAFAATPSVPLFVPGCLTGAGADVGPGRAVPPGTHGTSAGCLAPNGAPFQGEVPLTMGQTYAPGCALKVVCTAAGSVVVPYPDGSTGTWPVVVGTQTLPLAVVSVCSVSTAVASCFTLR